jgi:hypothetical protein
MQQPTSPSVHVPGIMRDVPDASIAPAGAGPNMLLSALPLSSLLGPDIAGDDDDSDSSGSENLVDGGDEPAVDGSKGGSELTGGDQDSSKEGDVSALPDGGTEPSDEDASSSNSAAASPLGSLAGL